jgi:hypothetical protein
MFYAIIGGRKKEGICPLFQISKHWRQFGNIFIRKLALIRKQARRKEQRDGLG